MQRSATAGKTGDGEIEAAPKEMHGARLADKAGAEEFEDAIGADERPPEVMGRLRIVG